MAGRGSLFGYAVVERTVETNAYGYEALDSIYDDIDRAVGEYKYTVRLAEDNIKDNNSMIFEIMPDKAKLDIPKSLRQFFEIEEISLEEEISQEREQTIRKISQPYDDEGGDRGYIPSFSNR